MSPERAGQGALLAALLAASGARAQACCAGASAVSPGRLAIHEDALVGAQLRARSLLGSHDTEGRFREAPAGTAEQQLDLSLVGTARIWQRGQLSLIVPGVLARRAVPGRSEVGGGVGDLEARGRVDVTRTGASATIPGVSLLGGVLAPTGRPADRAQKPLATDATGLGSWEVSAGATVEQTFGSWLLGATGLVALRQQARVQGEAASLAPRWSGLLAAAYTFESEAAVAVSILHTRSGESTIAGRAVPATAARVTTASLSGQLPLDDLHRLQVSLSAALPFGGLGLNSPAPLGLTFSFFRAWM